MKTIAKFNQQISNRDIMDSVKVRMKRHIGKDNAISQIALLRECIGSFDRYTQLEIYFYWMKVKNVLHSLRQRSYYFIACERRTGGYYYFILRNQQDLKVYEHQIERMRKGLASLLNRARVAVNEKWYLKLK